jgi:hypothetical protein
MDCTRIEMNLNGVHTDKMIGFVGGIMEAPAVTEISM